MHVRRISFFFLLLLFYPSLCQPVPVVSTRLSHGALEYSAFLSVAALGYISLSNTHIYEQKNAAPREKNLKKSVNALQTGTHNLQYYPFVIYKNLILGENV
jgi:hypothetical protein